MLSASTLERVDTAAAAFKAKLSSLPDKKKLEHFERLRRRQINTALTITNASSAREHSARIASWTDRVGDQADNHKEEPFAASVWVWGASIDPSMLTCPRPYSLNHSICACIRHVACGSATTMMVTNDGDVYSWGTGPALGRSSSSSQTHEKVEVLAKIVSVALSADHGLACDEAGRVFSWGNGKGGRLGLGVVREQMVPTQLTAKSLNQIRLIQVACGQHFSLALAENGTLFSWGTGRVGQLGLGPLQLKEEKYPKKVENLTDVVAVSCGDFHSVACDGEGKVWSWGFGEDGRTGLGHTETVFTPTQVKGGSMNENFVTGVACGAAHTLLMTNESVYAFGWNEFGQVLRAGDTHVPGTTDTAYHFTLPIRVFRASDWRQCGVHSPDQEKDSKTNCPSDIDLYQFNAETSIAKLAAGFAHSAILLSDSRLFMWGWGVEGQLGMDTESNVAQPKLVETLPAELSIRDVALGHCNTIAMGITVRDRATRGSSTEISMQDKQAQECSTFAASQSEGSEDPALLCLKKVATRASEKRSNARATAGSDFEESNPGPTADSQLMASQNCGELRQLLPEEVRDAPTENARVRGGEGGEETKQCRETTEVEEQECATDKYEDDFDETGDQPSPSMQEAPVDQFKAGNHSSKHLSATSEEKALLFAASLHQNQSVHEDLLQRTKASQSDGTTSNYLLAALEAQSFDRISSWEKILRKEVAAKMAQGQPVLPSAAMTEATAKTKVDQGQQPESDVRLHAEGANYRKRSTKPKAGLSEATGHGEVLMAVNDLVDAIVKRNLMLALRQEWPDKEMPEGLTDRLAKWAISSPKKSELPLRHSTPAVPPDELDFKKPLSPTVRALPTDRQDLGAADAASPRYASTTFAAESPPRSAQVESPADVQGQAPFAPTKVLESNILTSRPIKDSLGDQATSTLQRSTRQAAWALPAHGGCGELQASELMPDDMSSITDTTTDHKVDKISQKKSAPAAPEGSVSSTAAMRPSRAERPPPLKLEKLNVKETGSRRPPIFEKVGSQDRSLAPVERRGRVRSQPTFCVPSRGSFLPPLPAWGFNRLSAEGAQRRNRMTDYAKQQQEEAKRRQDVSQMRRRRALSAPELREGLLRTPQEVSEVHKDAGSIAKQASLRLPAFKAGSVALGQEAEDPRKITMSEVKRRHMARRSAVRSKVLLAEKTVGEARPGSGRRKNASPRPLMQQGMDLEVEYRYFKEKYVQEEEKVLREVKQRAEEKRKMCKTAEAVDVEEALEGAELVDGTRYGPADSRAVLGIPHKQSQRTRERVRQIGSGIVALNDEPATGASQDIRRAVVAARRHRRASVNGVQKKLGMTRKLLQASEEAAEVGKAKMRRGHGKNEEVLNVVEHDVASDRRL